MRISKPIATFIFAVICSISFLTIPMFGAEALSLRVGAAKVDSTPTDLTGLTTQWRKQFTSVHDHIYVRALVMDNGMNTVAIVAVDLIQFPDTTPLRERIAKETGIPVDHQILTASHAHASPRAVSAAKSGAPTPEGGVATAAYSAKLYDQIVDAVKKAKAALQPARMGIGTGMADVNINRDEFNGKSWDLGINPKGPSDKTVWTVKYETLTGEPIAVLFNYAVHSVIAGPDNDQLTGDLAGAAERYVEKHYNDKVVALFTIGPAGDQNPKYIGPGQAEQEAIPSFDAIAAEGLILGAEVVRTANHIQQMTSTARITAAEREIICPTKPRQPNQGQGSDQGRPTNPQGPVRQGPVSGPQPSEAKLHLGLIRVNDVAFTGVSGEVVTNIYWHLKKESPLRDTIMITMANDRQGYIIDDAAYDTPIFEFTASQFARGCVENKIVSNLVEMINNEN